MTMPTKRARPGVGEGIQLQLDAFLLIEKPPATAELDLSRSGLVLKVAGRSREDVIIGRVVVVNDGTGQRVFRLEQVEIRREGRGLREVANRVEAGVGPSSRSLRVLALRKRAE